MTTTLFNFILTDANVEREERGDGEHTEEAFEDRTIKQDVTEDVEMLPRRQPVPSAQQSDRNRPRPAPGYGDSVKRDPAKVAGDGYRVILEVDGEDVTVREEATESRREEIRQRWIDEATVLGGEGG